MLAIIDAYRSGLLQPRYWWHNLIAGVVVGVVALPLAMAFAIASGAKPEQGLYTAIIAGLVVGVFGGSRVQIAGPTGAFVVILSGITAKYGIAGLQLATLMAGIILLLFGLTKLGNLIKFIPDPVILGFTSGIGVIIFIGSWKDFFGISVELSQLHHFHEKLFTLVESLPGLNLETTGLACLSLIIVLITPYLKGIKCIPGPLAALIVVSLLQAILKFPNVMTIGSAFGGIPDHLPNFALPEITFNNCIELIGPAFTIALLGSIESLLSAVVADGMGNTRHNPNQELIGQGLANIICPMFGGFAATGAIARTATNIRNGGNSPLSSIIHSLTLVAIILFLSPLAIYIPLCTLAAILFVVAYNMSDAHHFFFMLKHAPRNDILILLTTFGLTIFTDLVVAVNVGGILAILFFVQRMSQSVSIDIKDAASLREELSVTVPNEVLVYTIQGPFFFGAAEKLEHISGLMHMDPKFVIFRLKHVPFMDITGLQIFYDVIQQFHHRGVKVYICEANPRVSRKISKIKILEMVQENRIFSSLQEAVDQLF